MSELQPQGPGAQPQPKRYLSVRERESIGDVLGAHLQMEAATSPDGLAAMGLPATVSTPLHHINKRGMSERAKELKRVLQEGTPPPLNEKERDALSKRAKELEEKFKKHQVLETFEELNVKNMNHPAWLTATNKARMRPKFESDIQEWKNIQRQLDPENPEADNLSQLRKQRD